MLHLNVLNLSRRVENWTTIGTVGTERKIISTQEIVRSSMFKRRSSGDCGMQRQVLHRLSLLITVDFSKHVIISFTDYCCKPKSSILRIYRKVTSN